MRRRVGRLFQLSLLAALLAGAPRTAQGQVAEGDTLSHWDRGWASGPVTNAILDRKIRDAVPHYKDFSPLPRVAFYTITYPKDCKELEAMKGYALTVITAFSQDSTELPPGRVFVHTAAGTRHLIPFAALESHVPAADSVILHTYGPYRGDFLYLFPSDQARAIGDLMLDFALHFSGYRLAHFEGETPRILLMCTPVLRTGRIMDSTVVWTMFNREFPDVARAIAAMH